MSETLRAGVIGAGVFGGYHAQKWSRMDGVRLTAILDSHPERAADLAGRIGGQAFSEMDKFLAAVDVVSITSPATSHGRIALRALKAGKAVYVEKPLAVGLGEADAILSAAAERRLVVACGFNERVALLATGLPDFQETPWLIETKRNGTPSPRNRDVSVVLDLMIHDIDLMLMFAGGSPLTAECEGTANAEGLLDTALAQVSFTGRTVATLEASRIAAAPERRLKLCYASGEVEIDFLSGTLTNTTGFELDQGFADAPAVADPLRHSLELFRDAVCGRCAPLANGLDGARALDLALAVEQAVGG